MPQHLHMVNLLTKENDNIFIYKLLGLHTLSIVSSSPVCRLHHLNVVWNSLQKMINLFL